MNFIFFSVHFPEFIKEFSFHLHNLGARVLGIGDVEFHHLDQKLQASLADYYRVENLGDYDEVLRAVGYFTFKYGKIDRFESLNEHWLELEAAIRTDFNIEGVKAHEVGDIRQKSRMKHFFRKSGVKVIPYVDKLTPARARKFAATVGYPIIVKPDKGSGASMTYRIDDEAGLREFFDHAPQEVDFIAEAFIDGAIVTYDGLIGRDGKVLFESSTVYDQSIMDVVNNDDHVHYISLPKIEEDVREAGKRIIETFHARERFFHIELFRSAKDGGLVALEVNMRPPGAWMTDSINYTHDMDIYREWATMVMNGRVNGPFEGRYYTAYASRKEHKRYRFDHQRILQGMNGMLLKHSAIEPVFSRAMGNYAYQFRSESREEVEQLIKMVQEEAGS